MAFAALSCNLLCVSTARKPELQLSCWYPLSEDGWNSHITHLKISSYLANFALTLESTWLPEDWYSLKFVDPDLQMYIFQNTITVQYFSRQFGRTIFVGFNTNSLQTYTGFQYWDNIIVLLMSQCVNIFSCFISMTQESKVSDIKWLFSWWNPWPNNSLVIFPWSAFKDDFHFVLLCFFLTIPLWS